MHTAEFKDIVDESIDKKITKQVVIVNDTLSIHYLFSYDK